MDEVNKNKSYDDYDIITEYIECSNQVEENVENLSTKDELETNLESFTANISTSIDEIPERTAFSEVLNTEKIELDPKEVNSFSRVEDDVKSSISTIIDPFSIQNEKINDENESSEKKEVTVRNIKGVESVSKATIQKLSSRVLSSRAHNTAKFKRSNRSTLKVNKYIFEENTIPQPNKIDNQENEMLTRLYSYKEEEKNESEVDTVELLNEANRRANFKNLAEMPKHRFVLGKKMPVIDIEDVLPVSDLQSRDIIGILEKRGKKGIKTKNWASIKNSFFTLYKSKRSKVENDTLPNYAEWDMLDPTDSSYFFKKKYTFPLNEVRIFLNRETSLFSKYFCYGRNPPTDLEDITENTIISFLQKNNSYIVEIKSKEGKKIIQLFSLDFVLKFNDENHFYRAPSVSTLLKWIIAIQLRKGRKICSIG